MTSKIKFGTDGWRAVIAEDFTFENVRIAGQAYSDYLLTTGNGQGAAIGYDTRFLSERFAKTIADVLASNGIPVFLSEDFIPTPVLSFAVKNRSLAGGIMITASHNPHIYNGIKFKGEYGGPVNEAVTKNIEKLLGKNEPKYNSKLIEKNLAAADFFKEYAAHIENYADFSLLERFKGSIVFDAMHGAGCGYLQKLLDKTGIRLKAVRNEPDPQFGGICPEPIAKNLNELQSAVVKSNAAAGLALDGDADRFGVLDHLGNFVELHDLMPMLFEHLLRTRNWPGNIVRTTSMADTIDRAAAKHSRSVIEVPVGFKNVTDQMISDTILIGGEESGGFGYYGHIPERDGLLSCLLVLELLADTQKTLPELVEELRNAYGDFAYSRVDEYFDTAKLNANLEALRKQPPKMIGGFKIKSVTLIDGIKFCFENGSWMLMRVSQTEPLGRIYAASTAQNFVTKIIEAGRALLMKE